MKPNSGLRRAAEDNDLCLSASKRHEALCGAACWLAAIAMGVFMGWQAAEGLIS